jgi:hypothetical protein
MANEPVASSATEPAAPAYAPADTVYEQPAAQTTAYQEPDSYRDPEPARNGSPGGDLVGKTKDETAAAIERDAIDNGAEIVAGSLILGGKRLGEYRMGQFVPEPGAINAWQDKEAKPKEEELVEKDERVDMPPGVSSAASSNYDPLEHEPVPLDVKMNSLKRLRTLADIDRASVPTVEEAALVKESEQAAVDQAAEAAENKKRLQAERADKTRAQQDKQRA